MPDTSVLANNHSNSTVSIVIPMLNETSELHQLKQSINALEPQPTEILFVDGGSHDGSIELARALGFQVLEHPIANRASQINAGVYHAKGAMICILHADSRLPIDAIRVIQETLTDTKTSLAGFTALLTGPEKTRWLTSFHNWIKTWYAPLLFRPIQFLKGGRLLFGDHAMFFNKSDFMHVGGCDENLQVMEDAELCLKFCNLGKIRLIPRITYTSDRRIQEWGGLKANLIFIWIALMWGLGFRRQFNWLYPDIRRKVSDHETQNSPPSIAKHSLK